MPIGQSAIELIFRDDAKRAELEPLCQNVLEHFQLPQHRLICIFDDDERLEFASPNAFGASFRGFFAPVRQFGSGGLTWPQDILNYVWIKDGLGKRWGYDVAIYLRGRTCQSPTGTVITFAHELQHAMQYGFYYKAWRAEHRIKCVFTDGPAAPWSFPSEYEAQLVSKKVANLVLGADLVFDYAEKHVRENNDSEKWEFFKGLDPKESFDLIERINPWVNKYREVLKEQFPAYNSEEPDFEKAKWSD